NPCILFDGWFCN
ncbi:unnamed protein product, partial [Allacma fusca]